MNLKIKIRKDYTSLLLIFLFLMENCFYLINTSKINILGKFAYTDIWMIFLILVLLYAFFKYRKAKTTYQYSYIILALCLLTFTSAIQQNRITDQPLMLGFRPQRLYFVLLLSYFPIRKLIGSKKLDIERLIYGIYKLGIMSALLYILQVLVYPDARFIYAIINNSNGGTRIYIDSTVIHVAGMIALYQYCKKYHIKYLLSYIICFCYVFFVSRGRLELLAYLASSFVGVIFTRNFTKKRFLIVLAVIIGGFIFLNTSYADTLFNSIRVAQTATTAQGNTMAIRYEGRELYMSQMSLSLQSMLFGCGYPNLTYSKAVTRAGLNRNIGLNDNGIFGFAYIYGLIGVAVIIVLFVKLGWNAWKYYKKTSNNIFIMYVVMQILLAYNIIFWYWKADGTFIMVLMLAITEELTCRRMKKHIGEQQWIRER